MDVIEKLLLETQNELKEARAENERLSELVKKYHAENMFLKEELTRERHERAALQDALEGDE